MATKALKEPTDHLVLENGIRFITQALERLLANRDRPSLEFGLIYFWTGIELLLKQPLLDEHWSLVVSEPGAVNVQEFNAGNFISIDYRTALIRLKGVCRVQISDSNERLLSDVRNKRNRLLHMGLVDPEQAVMSSVAKALKVLLQEYLPAACPDDDFTAVTALAHSLDAYVNEVWTDIKVHIDNGKSAGRFIFSCPACHQRAGFVKEGILKCLFCRKETDDTFEIAYENRMQKSDKFELVEIVDGCCDDVVLEIMTRDNKGTISSDVRICCCCGNEVESDEFEPDYP